MIDIITNNIKKIVKGQTWFEIVALEKTVVWTPLPRYPLNMINFGLDISLSHHNFGLVVVCTI